MERFIHTYKVKSVWNSKNKSYTQIKYMTNKLININNIDIIEDNSVKYNTTETFITVYTKINWLKVFSSLLFIFIIAGGIWLLPLLPIVQIEKVLWIFVVFDIFVIAIPLISMLVSQSSINCRNKYIVAREDIQGLEIN